ncbi:unnamed protein product [Polarella glacialis]|uniref:RRM domain-containing protein n=1 Tax=Polarella glacialis TaxID=89957 RepID=A0A813JEJ5_POLGL|nr:unnamed protein product [Polarella glacialis]
MWQMQMGSHNPMMMPPWPPAMPMVSPLLTVKVDGLKFDYQLTEDDVRKVFSRYGEVVHVNVDRDGTTSQVQFEQPHQAMAAQHDLDRKQLAGMHGAKLPRAGQVELYILSPVPSCVWTLLKATIRWQRAQEQPDRLARWFMVSLGDFLSRVLLTWRGKVSCISDASCPAPSMAMAGGLPGSPGGGRPKKYTCKLEVGIENEGEFRVGSRVIQIARQIWQDPSFQEHGGKTRLRGKGIGGPHEADEPLALCISCRDQAAFDKATQYAESQLQKVHADYKAFCVQKGRPEPELTVKISKKGTSSGPGDPFGDDQLDEDGEELPRGERPLNAPTDEEIEKCIEERNEARKGANFKRADEVRDYLKARGVVLMDEKGAKGNFKGISSIAFRFMNACHQISDSVVQCICHASNSLNALLGLAINSDPVTLADRLCKLRARVLCGLNNDFRERQTPTCRAI